MKSISLSMQVFRYFLLLNKHKRLYLKRRIYNKGGLIVAVFALFMFLFLCLILYVIDLVEQEPFKISMYLCPLLLMADFSVRFFLKNRPTVGILPYLCLPIERKYLILYTIFSELEAIGIWGCLLVYALLLYVFDLLTPGNAALFFVVVVLNNYLAVLIHVFTRKFVFLLFPFALIFMAFMLYVVMSLKVAYMMIVSLAAINAVIIPLFFLLKRNLYKELDNVSF